MSPSHQPATSASIDDPASLPAKSPWNTFPYFLKLLIAVDAIGIPLAGVLALLADWFTTTQLVRPWYQCSAILVASTLLLAAGVLRSYARLRRIILLCGGVILVLAVLDSLDGQQDWLLNGALILTAWALLYAMTCLHLLDMARPRSRRRRIAISLLAFASIAYLGVAGYYTVLHITIAPVQLNQHPLFMIGGIILPILTSLGEIGGAGSQLKGKVQVCPSCGLHNIPERTHCKECHASLQANRAEVDTHSPS